MGLTLKKYLAYALTLPLIIPAILWVLAEILPSDSFFFKKSLIGDIGGILVMSLIFGGVPYTIFLIFTGIFYRNKSGKKLLEYCYFSPLIFYVMIMIYAVLYRLYEIMTDSLPLGLMMLQNFFGAAVIYGIYTLFIGYGYVGVTVLVLFTLRKFDIVNSK